MPPSAPLRPIQTENRTGLDPSRKNARKRSDPANNLKTCRVLRGENKAKKGGAVGNGSKSVKIALRVALQRREKGVVWPYLQAEAVLGCNLLCFQ